MKLRYLVLLVAIDDLRSVHKAAGAMHISQPAATKLLGELERQVGSRLFDRTTRGLTPTDEGTHLIRHARLIVETVAFAWEEQEALRAGATGKVRVGSVVAAEATLLPLGIEQLKSAHPAVTVSIQSGTFDSLIPELKAGALDLVIARVSDDRDTEGLRCEPLYEEPMSIVVRTRHPLARKRRVDLRMLADYPWIWPPTGSVYRSRLEAVFRNSGIALPVDLVESESMLVNEALMRRTDRVAAFPSTVADELGTHGGFLKLPLALPPPSGKLGIILPETAQPSVSALAMIEALRSVAADILPH